MAVSRTLTRFADILRKAGLVDEMQLKRAIAECEQWEKRLPRVLAELEFANEDEIVEVLAKNLRLPVTHLGNLLKDNGAMKALGAEFCEKHAVFPVTLRDRTLTLAMADPTDLDVVDAAGAKAHARVIVQMAAEGEIQTAINRHFYGKELAAPRRTAPRKSDRMPSGITGEMPAVDVGPRFSEEEIRRLESAALNQEKVGAILRAVQELLAEKGVVRR